MLKFLIFIVLATLRYWEDEAANKNYVFNRDEWSMISMGRSTPQQRNCIDCGMFVAITVDFLMAGLALNFCQKDIGYFRMRLSVDIIYGYLSSGTFCKNDSNIPPCFLLLDNSPSEPSKA